MMRKFVISCVLLAAASIANATTTFTWIFDTGSTQLLGTTSVFSNNGVSITASGYASNGVTEDLYSKNLTGNEKGLGLANDPSGQDEIYYGTDFIQLNLANVIAAGITNLEFAMNSTTSGESWGVYNTASAGTLVGATALYSGTGNINQAPTLNTLSISPSKQYVDFVVTAPSNGNVLLYELTGTTPEPATFVLAGSALLGLALLRRKKRSASV